MKNSYWTWTFFLISVINPKSETGESSFGVKVFKERKKRTQVDYKRNVNNLKENASWNIVIERELPASLHCTVREHLPHCTPRRVLRQCLAEVQATRVYRENPLQASKPEVVRIANIVGNPYRTTPGPNSPLCKWRLQPAVPSMQPGQRTNSQLFYCTFHVREKDLFFANLFYAHSCKRASQQI